MLFNDNFQSVSAYSEQVHDFLSLHLIAPSPVNYSVIYLYITKENPQLNAAIDLQLKKDVLITADFMEELFARFVSLRHQFDQTILNPFEQSLANTLEKINLQVSNENKTSDSLEKLDKILTNTKHHNSLEGIVNFLFGTISNTQIQHQNLSKELIKAQQELHQLKDKLEISKNEAIVDSLTGLLNRRGCDEKLKDLNSNETHSSLAIDIDHFKKINDQFGHFVGDKVIQRIASTIKKNISEQDLAIRYGGEEFVVVMVNKNAQQAEKTAEKIRLDIANMKLVQRDSNVPLPPISVSIGIAENNNTPNWQELFKQADTALYQAKNTGRNRCVCA